MLKGSKSCRREEAACSHLFPANPKVLGLICGLLCPPTRFDYGIILFNVLSIRQRHWSGQLCCNSRRAQATAVSQRAGRCLVPDRCPFVYSYLERTPKHSNLQLAKLGRQQRIYTFVNNFFDGLIATQPPSLQSTAAWQGPNDISSPKTTNSSSHING